MVLFSFADGKTVLERSNLLKEMLQNPVLESIQHIFDPIYVARKEEIKELTYLQHLIISIIRQYWLQKFIDSGEIARRKSGQGEAEHDQKWVDYFKPYNFYTEVGKEWRNIRDRDEMNFNPSDVTIATKASPVSLLSEVSLDFPVIVQPDLTVTYSLSAVEAVRQSLLTQFTRRAVLYKELELELFFDTILPTTHATGRKNSEYIFNERYGGKYKGT